MGKPALIEQDCAEQTEIWWLSGSPLKNELGLRVTIDHETGYVTLAEVDQQGNERKPVLMTIPEVFRLATIVQKSSLYKGGEKNHD